MTPDAAQTLAAIDIGTNSVHLVVARAYGSGRFEVVGREKEAVRLGSGQGEMKRLAPAAIDRAIEALRRFRKVADVADAPVRAVATSAVREAQNSATFLRRAWEEAGIDVEVISGFEEARLIHLGVLQAVPVYDRRALLVDIGGGSTELLVGERGEVLAARSLKLGAIRLTHRFFHADRLKAGSVDKARRYIRSHLVGFVREVDRLGFDVAVGSSGTIEAVAAMANARRGDEAPQTFNNFAFGAGELDAVVKELAGAPTVADRKKVPGLDASRADIILGGALILEQVVDAFGIPELLVSDNALREGVLLDTLQRLRGRSLHHLSDLRRRSVDHLAALMDDDPEHSARVAGLALALFDETRDRHGLPDDTREYLEAAALLCNVGLFLSHAQHHKHSYYVIRNSEHLTGFTDREIEVIAQVARYHRKSAPKQKHAEFARLKPADQELVRALAGLLRVAIALDRSHVGAVEAVRRVRGPGAGDAVELAVVPAADADVSLELYTAGEVRGLLEQVLGRDVRFSIAG
ncbi:MAG: Ppx/GppA family phosphatase [Acidimicrobiales bacterium]|nr:Ppx/GppA family phosphatase [Acidimicrobiales bacterium]MCB1017971.1 Ppx/GppA family phosphatase [Acidimicrobiales bacterium]